MKLLCPNCQKELTVPDQYAGQQMKCPLCNGMFTAPVLAPPPGTAASAAPGPVPPKAETYTLANEPPAPPAATPSPVPPPLVEEAITARPRPEPERPADKSVLPPAGDYDHHTSVTLNPRAVPWIAPGALLLVFILLFFAWVNTYLQERYWQTGWGTGFGHEGTWAGVLYLLLFLPSLLLAIASAVLPFIPKQSLPAIVNELRPWRLILVGGVLVGALFLLGLQIWPTDFGLEQAVANPPRAGDSAEHGSLARQLQDEKTLKYARLTLARTRWLWLALLLHFVALGGVVLEFWLDRRRDRPPPRVDLHW